MRDIYDRMAKKIFTLSPKAVINLVNGLFDTDYPTDSEVSYNWTEHVGDQLRHILADSILTINGVHSYHIEMQLLKDDDIVFRMFEYGFGHADKNRMAEEEEDNVYRLRFPEPVVIYLYARENVPDEYVLRLDFGEQGSFDYKVPVVKFLDTTPAELTARKLGILIPFELLKLRKKIEQERSPENLEALKKLIKCDILGCIEENFKLGNITEDDVRRLKRLTHYLYTHLYAKYSGMEEITMLTDESLMLDIDVIEQQHEKELADAISAKDIIIHTKDVELSAKDKELSAKDKELSAKDKELSAKDKELSTKDEEIRILKEQMKGLQEELRKKQ